MLLSTVSKYFCSGFCTLTVILMSQSTIRVRRPYRILAVKVFRHPPWILLYLFILSSFQSVFKCPQNYFIDNFFPTHIHCHISQAFTSHSCQKHLYARKNVAQRIMSCRAIHWLQESVKAAVTTFFSKESIRSRGSSAAHDVRPHPRAYMGCGPRFIGKLCIWIRWRPIRTHTYYAQ